MWYLLIFSQVLLTYVSFSLLSYTFSLPFPLFSTFFSFDTGSHYIAQVGLELTTLQP